MILYRHFASKADLYREVIESAHTRLREDTGADDFDDTSIPSLVRAAVADPDAFRLLYRYATREPEFREMIDTLSESGPRSPAATLQASSAIDGGAGRRDFYPP